MVNSNKSLRERLGLTQAEIATELGITTSTYSKWERDEEHAPSWLKRYLHMKVELEAPGSSVFGSHSTIKDPLHRKILEALNGPVSASVFERCVDSLLQQMGMRVVLVGGTGDCGFDGEVEDDEAEPSPLIVTTSTDLLQNMTRNLSKARDCTTSRRVYLATTKKVRAKTRKKIRKVATDDGFTVGQIFDQNWVAEQLYHNSRWRKELLDVSGHPSVLRSFPESSRPLIGDLVIGRETELKILRESKADCLLIGPPGSGKTIVLRQLVRENDALFLCDGDKERIANELRDKRPNIVLVDDAHAALARLNDLFDIRREIGAEFRIIASSWSFNSFVTEISGILGIDRCDMIALDPLSQRQIFDIVLVQGVMWRPVQAVICQQSGGMPGLAVSLCQFILRNSSNLDSLVSGEALLDDLLPKIVSGIDKDVLPLLATIAVGGSAGMDLGVVAKHLNESETKLLVRLRDLDYAGIIYTDFDGSLVVRPYSLTYALVRRVFFESRTGEDLYLTLLQQARSLRAAVNVLISIHAYGANIRHQVEESIKKHKKHMVTMDLIHFASIGKNEARFVLDEFPERILEIARGVLRVDPENCLPMLFDHVIDDSQNFEGAFSQLQDVLTSWLLERSSEYPEALARRTVLIETSIDWIKRRGDWWKKSARVINFALTKAFEGYWEGTTPSPIELEIWYYSCVPSVNQTIELQARWQTAVDFLCESATHAEYWVETIDLIRQWCNVLVKETPDEQTLHARRNFATNIRNDLAQRFEFSPGLLLEIVKWDEKLLDCSKVHIDQEFQLMYPRSYDMRSSPKDQLPRSITSKYRSLDPESAAKRLAYFESEAQKACIRYPRLTVQLCQLLAGEVHDPIAWLTALLNERCPGDLLKPFMIRNFDLNPRFTVETISQHIDDNLYLPELLTISKRDKELFQMNKSAFIEYISKYPSVLNGIDLATDTDETVLLELLETDNKPVAYIVALAYYIESGRQPKNWCSAAWKQALLNGNPKGRRDLVHDDCLEKILAEDRDLTMRWLQQRYSEDHKYLRPRYSRIADRVIKPLSAEDRGNLILEIEAKCVPEDEVISLVGSEPRIYRLWLDSASSESKKLAPLTKLDRVCWRDLLLVALDHTFTPECIATHVANDSLYSGNTMFFEICEQKRSYCDRFKDDNDNQVVKTVRLINQELDYLIEEENKVRNAPFSRP